jgi:hypothetical protein
MCVCIIKLAWL